MGDARKSKENRRKSDKVMIFSLLLAFGLLFIGCTDFSEHSIEAEGEEKQETTAKSEPKPVPKPETETETETEISALAEINKAATAQAMQAALETYAEVLEFDLTVYSIFSQASKTVVAQYVVINRIYANEDAVRTAFAAALQAAATAEINNAATAQAMQAALETYAQTLELDLTVYNNILSQASKTVVAQYVVINRIYADKDAVKTAFAAALQAAATAEINKAATAQAMKAALETYAQTLELDLTVYNMLSQASKTVTEQYVVANRIYADKDAVQTAFAAALQTAATANKNLSQKFAITQGITGAALVTASFNAVHNYVQAAVFTTSTTQAQSIIKLGDYIDLASLTVAGDTGHGTEANYGYINKTSDLRLIVIGINSFNGKNGNNTPHVVFHFNDVPGKYRMNDNDENTTGYLGSAMRSYITGNFLTGLKNAGVPDAVLWQPSRIVASRGKETPAPQTITDKLWLPTEREMFGFGTYTNIPFSVTTVEKAENQANFTEFYTDDNARIKSYASNNPAWYWLASPRSGWDSFCSVNGIGATGAIPARGVEGCVPAFCVQ